MSALIDAYDAALFDLDGVVYLGPVAVPGAVEGLASLRERGTRIGFVTNNAARAPQVVVDHLNELGIRAGLEDVVVSSQAGARLLAERVPAESRVLVVGTEALIEEVRRVGLTPVSSVEEPVAAVIQGYHPHLPWELINQAAYAIQAGAVWVATNLDSTRPTDLGLVPGAGAQIGALRNAVSVDPLVAGKPFTPLLTETVNRLAATHPLFVGDRIDTDIDGAAAVGMDSLLVLSGAHGKADAIAAVNRPTHIGWDLRALLAPAADVTVNGDSATCGQSSVSRATTGWQVSSGPGAESQLDALRAMLALAEPGSDVEEPGLAEALAVLDLVP
ncbi:HAD-IIA family hydrolase [Ammonicoccus fulvus]|uniref:HAD-IIA family hydrolase n=1 Tax=Ammonicoccus fulvus TaxID=3138240 RepID=A0ABZ3FS66_9ACTN